MAPPPNSAELVEQFCAFTQATPSEAQRALESDDWQFEVAVQNWFAIQQGETELAEDEPEIDNDDVDEPQPIPSTSGASRNIAKGGSSSKQAKTPGGIRTLSDLGGGHDHGDDDDHSDNDYFTGGEKSGLAVHGNNPASRDPIQGLLDRARANAPRPGGDDDDDAPQNRFSGRGVTLGGDDAPSRVIETPGSNTSARQPAPRVSRTLHLWQDGFSVDDGDLYRYDDPANQEAIRLIQSGSAPLHLLNVEHGQQVDLSLDVQKDQPYVKPKAKYKPFAGQGQRLGSPAPGPSSSSIVPAPVSQTTSSTTTQEPPQVSVDSSQPTITLQVRLGDGTRLQSRFNTTHTIGDVYEFVDRASPASGRAYALMTTFPSKELDDRSTVIGDLSEFKRGGVVVQKWK